MHIIDLQTLQGGVQVFAASELLNIGSKFQKRISVRLWKYSDSMVLTKIHNPRFLRKKKIIFLAHFSVRFRYLDVVTTNHHHRK